MKLLVIEVHYLKLVLRWLWVTPGGTIESGSYIKYALKKLLILTIGNDKRKYY